MERTERMAGWYRQHDVPLLVLISFVFLLAVLWFYSNGTMPDQDVLNFYTQAMDVRNGLLPYRDFELEFPPFAMAFFYLPIIFTTDLWSYAFLFGIEMIACSALALWAVLTAAKRAGIGRGLPAFLFTFFVAVYLPMLAWKFDMAPVCFTALALAFFLQKRYLWAYTLLAAGAMTKFYPALLVLVFLIINLSERADQKHWRNAVGGLIVCAIVVLLAVVPLLLAGVSSGDLVSVISFHSGRGFQIESIVANFSMCLSQWGFMDTTLVGMHYTYDVSSTLTDMLEPIWLWVTAAVVLLVLLLIARDVSAGWDKWSASDRTRRLAVYFVAVLLAFMLVNKVFSTQYVLWLFPFLALLSVGRDGRFDEGNAIIYGIMVGISTVIAVADCRSDSFALINLIRNYLLFVIMGEMLALLAAGRGPLQVLFEQPDLQAPSTASI
ncbi:MAG: glycosyltransferase 87 family protein [Candidatus Methanomethylophilus sp.]|nr:glycosyltransferase 87 family protein [Methanomethylophilus sp.]